MYSRVVRFTLVSTSLAPALLVYGVALWGKSRWGAVTCLVGTAALLLACLGFLVLVRKTGAVESYTIKSITHKDSEILAFLVAYVLPLVAAEQKALNLAALVTFALIAGIVLFQSNIMHVNPLLGLLGYHFFEATTTDEATYLLITTRSRTLRPELIRAVPLSPSIILESANG